DYDPLPFYMEPKESPLRPIAKDYPLTMTNGRLPMYHHGTLRNNPYLRELYPVPEIWINPITARKYGVSHGDWTWVESKRGKIRAVARVTEGISPMTVYMERFWLPENIHKKTGGWQEVNVNVLSDNTPPYNEVVGTYTLRGYQVRISKASSAPEGVWTKPEQFQPWMPQPSDPTKAPEM
ncbi:MAG: molybdopterin oxidoreductase, partial [Duodenibacillus sp.]|nr:molybdopterin oxidoreductase [Duodenibacillus sp.]